MSMELRANPCPKNAFLLARKRPLQVRVVFAETPGTMDTLEGSVHYEKGAALLTGTKGERWPVERAKFEASHEAAEGQATGSPGLYRRKPLVVRARQLGCTTRVKAGYADDELLGKPGDWLVQYGPDDFGIVAAEIFPVMYELQDSAQPASDTQSTRKMNP